MTDDANTPPTPPAPHDGDGPQDNHGSASSRRDFLKVAGAGAGLILVGGHDAAPKPVPGFAPRPNVPPATASSDIVVIGAGGWGSFTALNLMKRGAKSVTLVDAYGPGNARSTSGDETRGVRSSYGDRPGAQGEHWTLWAREAMKRWIAFDDEWGKAFRLNVYHTTGDLIFRQEWDNFQLRTKIWWDKNKIPYQIVDPVDVRKAYPVISLDDMTAILYEPDAGVVRARRATQAAASAFETLGGKIIIGRATPGRVVNGKLEEVVLDTGQHLRADTFVFAVGPWMAKTFPELLAKKARAPMGYVCYFATPMNDERFTFPNLPSYNFPGVTGWPALPVDNRGFRVRGTERAPTPAGAADGRGGAAAGAGDGRGGALGGPPPGAAAAAVDSAGGRGRGGAGADSTGRGGRGAGAADSTGGRGGRGRRGGGGGAGAGTAGAAGGAAGAAGGQGGRGAGGGGAGGAGAQGGGQGGGAAPDANPNQTDPDLSDRWADASRIDGSRRFVAHRFPLLKDAPISQTHSCHYESTSSGNFIVDRHPGMPNAWIVAGGNSEGFKFCPVIGDYAAQRVLGIEGDPAIAKAFKIPEKDYDPPAPPPVDSTAARRPPAADSAAKKPPTDSTGKKPPIRLR